MMEYFELFDLDINLIIEPSVLKKKYFKLSRANHPDFYINESSEEQEAALLRSAKINEAYNTLRFITYRMEYILRSANVLGKDKQQLDPMFLIEMMDINEGIDLLTSNFDKEKLSRINAKINLFVSELDNSIQDIASQELIDINDTIKMNKLKAFYLKMKYISRIKEKLLTFAIQ